MSIRRLPMHLVNQIAAGEVIERPASVVKELLENSLDAGARRIDIAIEDGGRQLIRVSDDGVGIPPDELPLAVAPHATSKLTSADDLAAIRTLGFRGEALASIASVSRLTLTSRATIDRRTREEAAIIEVTGEEVRPVRPTAASPGTVIEVRDLFFNTPARRRFLRAGPTEFGHIAETLGRIAMIHPSVAFTLGHNGREVMDLASTDSPRRRCVEVLGKELDEALLEFGDPFDPFDPGGADRTAEAFGVWGLAGLPSIARATARFQYLCLNGRPIRDRGLTHALREAYRGLLPVDRQPVVVAMLRLPAGEVDVNVHPTKAEVRFRDASRMHGLLLNTLRQRLLGADLTPTVRSVGTPMPGPIFDGDHTSQASVPDVAPTRSATPPAAADGPSVSAFVDYFRRMAPQHKGFVFQEVKRALAEEDPALLEPTLPLAPAAPTAPAADSSTDPRLSILQVKQSYVVTEDEDGIVIIDQHALHERVMFEELRQRVLGPDGRPRNLESQRMLMPAMLTASPRRLALVQTLAPLLERLGIELAPMGPSTLAVQAFPTFLFDRNVEPTGFVTELLDRAEEGELDADPPGPVRRRTRAAESAPTHAAVPDRPDAAADASASLVHEALLHKVLDMMACKAAVKAGDRLTPGELEALLARRREIERSSNCPHGRPTQIRLTLKDLEKRFGRA